MDCFLLGDSETHPLERRVLIAAIFGSSIITSLILIQSLVIRYSPITIIFIFVLTLIFWSLYFQAKSTKEKKWLLWAYLILNDLTILLDWFYFGGFLGVGLLVLLLLTGFMPLYLERRAIRIGIGLNILTMLIVAIGFMTDTAAVLKYTPNAARVWVRLVEISIFATGVFIVSLLVINAYRKEREKIDTLNKALIQKNNELTSALSEVKTLQGLIPICANCKKIRNDAGFYESVEEYITQRTDADFSHTVCPDCMETLYGDEPWFDKLEGEIP